jgi:hypothetical protein
LAYYGGSSAFKIFKLGFKKVDKSSKLKTKNTGKGKNF